LQAAAFYIAAIHMHHNLSITVASVFLCVCALCCNGSKPGCPDDFDNSVSTHPCPGHSDIAAGLINPDNVVYVGAFRLPAVSGQSPRNFS